MKNLKSQRDIRRRKVRAKIKSTQAMPRLSVFRSNKHTYAQVIDDKLSKTIAAVSDIKMKNKSNKMEIAKSIGGNIAKIAIAKNVKRIVFDRGGYKYHGRIKALAEGAREGGLKF